MGFLSRKKKWKFGKDVFPRNIPIKKFSHKLFDFVTILIITQYNSFILFAVLHQQGIQE